MSRIAAGASKLLTLHDIAIRAGAHLHTGAKSSSMLPGFDGDPLVEITLRDLPKGEKARELKVWGRRDVIDAMVDKGRLQPYHREAARAFQADAERVNAPCSSSGEFMAGGHRTSFAPSDAALEAASRCAEARQRLRSCLDELGSEAEVFALAVLLNRATFLNACRFCGWPREMGPHALKLVLHQIARVYGLAPSEGDRRLRSWAI